MITFTTNTNFNFITSREVLVEDLNWIMEQEDHVIRVAELNTLRAALVRDGAPAEWLAMVDADQRASARMPRQRVESIGSLELYDIGAY